MFSMAMWMAALVAPVQIFVGDQHGLNTLEHQPAKIMAMEGHFQSHPDGAPLILFGMPDDEARDGPLRGRDPASSARCILKHDLERADGRARHRARPRTGRRSAIVFWSFRIMVGLGLPDVRARPVEPARAAAAASSTTGAGCTGSRWSMGPAGFVAVIAGWVTTEVGRQPWVIYGLLRTRDAVSPIAAPGGDRLADRLRHRLFHRLRGGRLYILRLMAHARRRRASAAPERRPDPQRRHHPGGAVARSGEEER